MIQLVGRGFESRKPALVAPLFLAAGVYFTLGLKLDLREEVERLVPRHLPDAAAVSPSA